MSLGLEYISDWIRSQRKNIYFLNEGSGQDEALLGKKGAIMCDMVRMGMPIPPAFILSADACINYLQKRNKDDLGLDEVLEAKCRLAIEHLENLTNKIFLSKKTLMINRTPLLLSVRTSAPSEMVGTKKCVLNLGLNDEIVESLARFYNNRTWAYHIYRKFIKSFGEMALGIDPLIYEIETKNFLEECNVSSVYKLKDSEILELIKKFKGYTKIPQDPLAQLLMSITCLFRTWNSPQAIRYRDLHPIKTEGIAVIVQEMIYGNINQRSGSGILYSRCPNTGRKGPFGIYMPNTGWYELKRNNLKGLPIATLQRSLPSIYESLVEIQNKLEQAYHDMQEIEFIIQDELLYIIECQTGKKNAFASLKIAIDLLKENIITEREAILQLDEKQISQFVYPMVDFIKSPNNTVIMKGEPNSGGVSIGALSLTAEKSKYFYEKKTPYIFCKKNASIGDRELISQAVGFISLDTMKGCYGSRISKISGNSCIVCPQGVHFDPINKKLFFEHSKKFLSEGDFISIDGTSGHIYEGAVPVIDPGQGENIKLILSWAEKYKNIHVLGYAKNLNDIEVAINMGAEGIGLYPVDSLLTFEDLKLFQKLLLSEDEAIKDQCCEKLESNLTEKFFEILKFVGPFPIAFRMLHRSINHFLPNPYSYTYKTEVEQISSDLGMSFQYCESRIKNFLEENPSLGCSGARLAIAFPDITKLITRSLTTAIIKVLHLNIDVNVRLLIPLIFSEKEVEILIPLLKKVSREVCIEKGFDAKYVQILVGVILEVPRACTQADKIVSVKEVDFVMIGPMTLTQLVFGMSKEDSNIYMDNYIALNVIGKDPFTSIDVHGVGLLMSIAVKKCKEANPNITIGIFGEHCEDPISLKFFSQLGIDCITSTPFKMPISILAAAKANLERIRSKI